MSYRVWNDTIALHCPQRNPMCTEETELFTSPDAFEIRHHQTNTTRSPDGTVQSAAVVLTTRLADVEEPDRTPSERPDYSHLKHSRHQIRFTCSDGRARLHAMDSDKDLRSLLVLPAAAKAMESVPGIDSVEPIEETIGGVIDSGRELEVTASDTTNDSATGGDIFR